MDENNCGTCRYYREWPGGPGLCRKNPPVVSTFGGTYGQWPEVVREDWCGEWCGKPPQGA